MKRNNLSIRNTLAYVATLLILLPLGACVNHIDGAGNQLPLAEPATLKVSTRSNADIAYPVTVYAFRTEDGELAGKNTIESAADDAVLIDLTTGSFQLVAVAGTAECTLPERPKLTDVITLTDAKGYATAGSLMMGSSNVTVTDADATTDITLYNCMTRIDLTLTDIPEGTQTVSVSLSPLSTGMSFNGNYEGSAPVTVPCTKQADGTWTAPTVYTFPGSGQQQVLSIALTDAAATHTYGYTHSSALKANTPYLLNGSYRQGFSVNGTITAAGWNPAETIGFTFGNNEGGGEVTPTPEGEYEVDVLPTTRSIWNGHFVAYAKKAADNQSADLLLLSLEEWTDVSAAVSGSKNPTQAKEFAAAYIEDGLTGWSIPNSDETDKIMANCGGVTYLAATNTVLTEAKGTALSNGTDSNGEKVRYLCQEGNYSYSIGGGSQTNAGNTRTYYLRVVKTVKAVIK